jgi:hypothetical protein
MGFRLKTFKRRWNMLLALGILLIILAYLCIDIMFPLKTITTVKGKEGTFEIVDYFSDGKVVVHPALYKLIFEIKGKEVKMRVSKELFDKTWLGDEIEVTHTRLSKLPLRVNVLKC